MNKGKRFNIIIWVLIVIMLNNFMVWKIFNFYRSNAITDTLFRLAEYPVINGFIEEAASGFFGVTTWQPIWDGIRIGMELFCSFYLL